MTTPFARKINRFFLAAALTLAMAAAPLPVLAAEFTDAQKSEIGALVRGTLNVTTRPDAARMSQAATLPHRSGPATAPKSKAQ